MDDEESLYVSLDGIERWWGNDIVTGEPGTALVTLRGRGPKGEPMLLTVRSEDFAQIAQTMQEYWEVDVETASSLAGRLILQQMVLRQE